MKVIYSKEEKTSPFLRWTGSKKWLVELGIDKYLPEKFNNYHEPFLGGGALFFHLNPKKTSYLSDINGELINTYRQIRDNVEAVIKQLKRFKNSEDDYYKVRSQNCLTQHTKAARFIYLNRTSFNGIYRVNSSGLYNVPYGQRENVDIVTEDNLRSVSIRLQGTKL